MLRIGHVPHVLLFGLGTTGAILKNIEIIARLSETIRSKGILFIVRLLQHCFYLLCYIKKVSSLLSNLTDINELLMDTSPRSSSLNFIWPTFHPKLTYAKKSDYINDHSLQNKISHKSRRLASFDFLGTTAGLLSSSSLPMK